MMQLYRYFCIIWNTVSIRNQYHALKKNLKRKKYCMKIFLKIWLLWFIQFNFKLVNLGILQKLAFFEVK